MVDFSVCVLLYGNHHNLAIRCLEALIADPSYKAYVKDFRIGLNNVCRETYNYVTAWGGYVADSGTPVVYHMPRWPAGSPAYKYPVMRTMLRDSLPLGANVMWFDDDSFLAGHKGWWDLVTNQATVHAAVGQIWRMPVQGNQREFFATQPWYRKELGVKDPIDFLQGGWWTIRSQLLLKHDWPIPELRHNGGDSMLGELLRHAGIPLCRFDTGVRINADEAGAHSKSPRRGHSEKNIGHDYVGQPLPIDHQNFTLTRWVARCGSPTT